MASSSSMTPPPVPSVAAAAATNTNTNDNNADDAATPLPSWLTGSWDELVTSLQRTMQPYYYTCHVHQRLLPYDAHHSLVIATTAGDGYHRLLTHYKYHHRNAADVPPTLPPQVPSSSSPAVPLGPSMVYESYEDQRYHYRLSSISKWNGSSELQKVMNPSTYYSSRDDTKRVAVDHYQHYGGCDELFPFTLAPSSSSSSSSSASPPTPPNPPPSSSSSNDDAAATVATATAATADDDDARYRSYQQVVNDVIIDTERMIVTPRGTVTDDEWYVAVKYCALVKGSYTAQVGEIVDMDACDAHVLPRDVISIVLLYLVPLIQVGRYFETDRYTYSNDGARNMSGALKAYQDAMVYDKHPLAAYKCGFMHLRGCNATRLSWTRAKYCLRYALLLGSDDALLAMAIIYLNRFGVKENNEEAVAQLKSSRHAVPWSQIGRRLFDGSSASSFTVNPWIGRAMCTIGMQTLVYTRAYQYNEAQDIFCYANWYEFGSCELIKSPRKAIAMYQQLHEIYSIAQAQLDMAYSYREHQVNEGADHANDAREAERYFRMGVAQGCPESMNGLADVLESRATQDEQLDAVLPEIRILLVTAARERSRLAAYNLGRLLYYNLLPTDGNGDEDKRTHGHGDDDDDDAPLDITKIGKNDGGVPIDLDDPSSIVSLLSSPSMHRLVRSRHWFIQAAVYGDTDAEPFINSCNQQIYRAASRLYVRMITMEPYPPRRYTPSNGNSASSSGSDCDVGAAVAATSISLVDHVPAPDPPPVGWDHYYHDDDDRDDDDEGDDDRDDDGDI